MNHVDASDPAGGAGEDTLGGRISHARDLAGLSMEEAARRLGVETETWRAWECDRDAPRANRLVTMAGLLGVSPTWLLTGTGSGPMPEFHEDGAHLARALEAALAEARISQQKVLDLLAHVDPHMAAGLTKSPRAAD